MDGGLDSRCVGRVYSADGAVRRTGVHETATYRCDDTRGCVMQF